MPKPASLPRWATDETNNDEPASGQKDTGWTPGQVAISDYFNWYQKLVYDWTVYLDGLEGEDFTTASGQPWTGDHEFEGEVDFEGDVEMLAGLFVEGGLVVNTADATINTVLHANGGVAADDGILEIDDNLDVNGNIEAQGNVVAGAGGSGFVQTTEGDIRHGDKRVVVPAAAGQKDENAGVPPMFQTRGGGADIYVWEQPVGSVGVGTVIVPVPLAVADRLKEVHARVEDDADTVATLTVIKEEDTTQTALGSTQTSASSGALQTLSVTGLTETIASGESIAALVTLQGTATGRTVLFRLEVVYDRP